jgi:hypothetical protein
MVILILLVIWRGVVYIEMSGCHPFVQNLFLGMKKRQTDSSAWVEKAFANPEKTLSLSSFVFSTKDFIL